MTALLNVACSHAQEESALETPRHGSVAHAFDLDAEVEPIPALDDPGGDDADAFDDPAADFNPDALDQDDAGEDIPRGRVNKFKRPRFRWKNPRVDERTASRKYRVRNILQLINGRSISRFPSFGSFFFQCRSLVQKEANLFKALCSAKIRKLNSSSQP